MLTVNVLKLLNHSGHGSVSLRDDDPLRGRSPLLLRADRRHGVPRQGRRGCRRVAASLRDAYWSPLRPYQSL